MGILCAGNGRDSLILHAPNALPHASATQNQSYLDHLWVGHGDLGGLLGGLDHADGVGHRVCKGVERRKRSIVSISTNKDIPGSLPFTNKGTAAPPPATHRKWRWRRSQSRRSGAASSGARCTGAGLRSGSCTSQTCGRGERRNAGFRTGECTEAALNRAAIPPQRRPTAHQGKWPAQVAAAAARAPW